jgi:exosortase
VLLLAILLFLFPYNSGDSSINSPLGPALWTIWTSSSSDTQDHTYCLLVPLMLAYLIYEKGSLIAKTPVRATNGGMAVIIIGLILFWIGSRAGKQYVGCAGIQLLILGVIYWFWGGAVFRRLLFAWAVVCFAWPLPFLDTAVAFPLRMIVSHTAYYALNIIGIPTIQDGTALISSPTSTGLPSGARFQIDIADPCSGLHSLLPLLMFSSFYCYFFFQKPWQRWTIFLSALPFTIAGNVVRILMLVLGCLFWGSAFAIGTNDEPSWYHEACGFAVFIVVLGLECLFGTLLIALCGGGAKSSNVPSAAGQEAGPPASLDGKPAWIEVPFWRSGTVLGLAAVAILVYWVTPPVYLPSEAGVLMTLPEQVQIPDLDGGHFYGSEAEVSEVEHRLLPKDTEFARKNYDDFHDHHVFFSIVLSGVQQYTIHPPEVCLVAQGWTIASHEDIPIQLASGHKMVVRNLSLQRDAVDEQQHHLLVKAYYMYWYVADNLTTPSHLERNLVSSWDRVVHNRDHRWAYVIAMSPITQTIRPDGMDAEQTRGMLLSFIRQIVPTFQKNELGLDTAHS